MIIIDDLEETEEAREEFITKFLQALEAGWDTEAASLLAAKRPSIDTDRCNYLVRKALRNAPYSE